MGRKTELKMLTRAQLTALNGQRLKNVLNSARAVHSANAKALAEVDCDAVDLKVQQKYKQTEAYLKLVKEVMKNHGDI